MRISGRPTLNLQPGRPCTWMPPDSRSGAVPIPISEARARKCLKEFSTIMVSATRAHSTPLLQDRDGGGSSTFFTRVSDGYDDPDRFKVLNWPTDDGGVERAIYCALVLVQTDAE